MIKRSRPQPVSLSKIADLSGRRFGDYAILRRLGQGGMGQVYLAEQLTLNRKVALKVLKPELADDANAMARFKLEAEAVAKATHSNIVQVYDFGQADGQTYMVLEYVDGRNLLDYIARRGVPDLNFATRIMMQVASALERAAELGITHRDIKPENILLTRKGDVKVADFGLSLDPKRRMGLNLTHSGDTMGTPSYMAPEQVEGKPIDPRTDIYSFGVTCYTMLTGGPPFQGSSPIEVAMAHLQREPKPLHELLPDLPEELCRIVHKMMAKLPEDRYQSARELSREISRLREQFSESIVSQTISIQVDSDVLNSIIPDDIGAIRPKPGSATEIGIAPPAVQPSSSGYALVLGLVALTILLSLAGGVLIGWRERATEGPLPQGEDIRPADALAGERIPRPSMRERALREAVDDYLSPGRGQDPRPGQTACMELGLFYLDAGRLDDARNLFQRLEKFNTPREFKGLGQIGRAVVLAMEHKPKESNIILKEIFTSYNPKSKQPKVGPIVITNPLKIRAEQQIAPVKTVLNHPRWHYYLSRTRYLNLLNGLKDDDMPPLFVLKAQELDVPSKKI